MSQASLKAFLEKLHRELSISSEEYRESTSNTKVHSFFVDRAELTSSIFAQITADGLELNSKDIAHVTKLANEYYEDLRFDFTMGNLDKSYRTVSSSTTSFEVIVRPKVIKGSQSSVFNSVKSRKQSAQKDFYGELIRFYHIKEKEFDEQRFLDITHQGSSASSRQQSRDVYKKLTRSKSYKSNKAVLEEKGIFLEILKDDSKQIVSISLGDLHQNRNIDQPLESAIKEKRKRALRNAINKLALPIANMQGPDSLVQGARKKVLRDALGRFAKAPKVVITSEDTKPRKSSKKPSRKISKSKTVVATSTSILDKDKIPTPPKVGLSKSRINLQALIPTLNQRLPAAVAANMGSPKLNYRTGRFAASAKITDITTTTKGHPSIGFTYMKSPYQVFEFPGGNHLATPDRDPRKIISESIREIAIGLIDQRFFTRRT